MATDEAANVKPSTSKRPVSKRSPFDFLLSRTQQAGVLICMGLYFQYFVYRTERFMDSYLNKHTFLMQLRDSVAPSPVYADRYLVFQPIEGGQGVGNIMHGLLAAQMLGLEFNRTVCVASDWDDFHAAFHVMKREKECASLDSKGNRASTIHLLNFARAPNECRLQERLSSMVPVLYLVGNTYPRWALTPPGLFDEHYEPTSKLINTLPYKKRPTTVVHLREPDQNGADSRKGLDEESLKALGKKLPADAFLVTNNVDFYERFESEHGWKNPGWHKVKHSALEGEEWGSQKVEEILDDDNTMQLWSDWYTILRADVVYHTHSDFSLSAIHWNEIDSKTIDGMDGEELVLVDEPWRRDEAMPRVVDRVGDELNNCDQSDDYDEMYGYGGDEPGMDDDLGDRFKETQHLTDDDPFKVADEQEHNEEKHGHDSKDRQKWEGLSDRFLNKEKPEDWGDDKFRDNVEIEHD